MITSLIRLIPGRYAGSCASKAAAARREGRRRRRSRIKSRGTAHEGGAAGRRAMGEDVGQSSSEGHALHRSVVSQVQRMQGGSRLRRQAGRIAEGEGAAM